LQPRLRRFPHVQPGRHEAGVGLEPQCQSAARDQYLRCRLGALIIFLSFRGAKRPGIWVSPAPGRTWIPRLARNDSRLRAEVLGLPIALPEPRPSPIAPYNEPSPP